MSFFNMLCDVLERMDEESYSRIFYDKTADIVPALMELAEDDVDGITIFNDFIFCAVAADGKLTEEEYLLIKPVLDLAYDRDTTFGDAQKFFYDNGLNEPGEYKRAMDEIVDLIGHVSPELKDDIVLVCLMVCAIDGEISDEERAWAVRLLV